MPFYPYLYFGGNCRQAFERYHEIFGGELTLLTGKDAPPGTVPEGKDDLIMHAALKIDDDLLMASDVYDEGFGPVEGMYVMYTTKDVDRARTVFEGPHPSDSPFRPRVREGPLGGPGPAVLTSGCGAVDLQVAHDGPRGRR